MLLGVDGISDFNGLHSRKHDDEVMFYAFDILVSDGEDLRKLPLSMRKTNLARLLARRVDGIFLSDFEQGEIGPDLFRHACLMGLEGLVSKHKDRPYRAGRSPHWVKVKNRSIPPCRGSWMRSLETRGAFYWEAMLGQSIGVNPSHRPSLAGFDLPCRDQSTPGSRNAGTKRGSPPLNQDRYRDVVVETQSRTKPCVFLQPRRCSSLLYLGALIRPTARLRPPTSRERRGETRTVHGSADARQGGEQAAIPT